jgi:CheY-like chemotaxis protein
MPGGGTLTIETKNAQLDHVRAADLGGVPPGRYVALVVRDTGTGMDEATLAHIFDPFFTTKQTGEGTGLGLATVYGIVKQTGGAISVKSAPGQGSSFTIYLPRAAEAAPERREERGDAEVEAGSETLLVVEDQERLRTVVALVLRGFGYQVLTAKDADEAARVVEAHPGPIDLLLTDVIMPRTSGPLLAERIQGMRPGVKVVFMSGYAADEMGGRLEKGAAFLQKPFGPEELARAVRKALSTGSSRA